MLYMESSTILGSIITSRSCSGVLLQIRQLTRAFENRLAGAGGTGHQQVGHFGEVGRYRLAAEICTPGMLRRWHAPEIWSYARVFAGVLDGIEEAMADGESFRATCRQFPRAEAGTGSRPSAPAA